VVRGALVAQGIPGTHLVGDGCTCLQHVVRRPVSVAPRSAVRRVMSDVCAPHGQSRHPRRTGLSSHIRRRNSARIGQLAHWTDHLRSHRLRHRLPTVDTKILDRPRTDQVAPLATFIAPPGLFGHLVFEECGASIEVGRQAQKAATLLSSN
jgi:hypothetical protein